MLFLVRQNRAILFGSRKVTAYLIKVALVRANIWVAQSRNIPILSRNGCSIPFLGRVKLQHTQFRSQCTQHTHFVSQFVCNITATSRNGSRKVATCVLQSRNMGRAKSQRGSRKA